MRHLIIIPTYNEAENITALIPALENLNKKFDVLVVDDNSPDGTSDIVLELAKSRPSDEGGLKLHLLKRENKQGLGRAYLAGFAWGLEAGYDSITEMDADFSHRPQDLPVLLEAVEEGSSDFIVGSRYIPGGATVNWGFIRKLISKGGGLYSRWILGYPLRDWTGGFNCWTRKSLETLGINSVKSEGYCFQIELKFRALKCGLKGKEVPITFEERRLGQSKMSLGIVLEAFYRVWLLRFTI